MFTGKSKPKPMPPVEITLNVPTMVNMRTFKVSRVVLIVTSMFAGIVIAHTPYGIIPRSHVEMALKAPD